MSIEAMKLAAEFNRYFTSSNGVDVPAKVSVSRDEWRALFNAIQQADVTDGIRPEDFTVDVVVKPMGGFAPANTKGVRVTHKPTGISVTCDAARSQHANRKQAFEKLQAILAQRPARVPMTDEQISLEAHNADDRDWNDLRFRSSWHEGFLEGARFAEAHHGITSQAKKETP